MQSDLPDLVADSQIRVEFKGELVRRFIYGSDIANGKFQRRKETVHFWEAEEELGRGAYGSVWLHRCLTSEDQAEVQAVKKLKKRVLSSAGISFVKELETIAKFSQRKYHGLFVEYQGWYQNPTSVFIAMEYIPHGDLSSYLAEPLPEHEAREISFQVAEGLDHLHQNKYVHRDIKPQNIFVVRKSPDWSVKIGDFGFSKRMTEASCLQSRVGTELYLAPEVKGVFPPEMDDTSATYTYSEKVDIWSLGILTFHMLFHDHPFTSKKPLELRKYIDGGPFPFPPSPSQRMSQHSTNFILAALARVAPERSSAQELLVSDWMKQRASDYATEMRYLNLARETTPETVRNTSQPHQSVQSKTTESFQIKDDPVGNIAAHSYEHLTLDSNETHSSRPPPNPTEAIEDYTLTQLKAFHDQARNFYLLRGYETAGKLLLKAFEGRRAATGPESKVTLESQSFLAKVYMAQTRFTEAESLRQAVLEARRKTLGPNHYDTMQSLAALAETQKYLGKTSQAKALKDEVKKIYNIRLKAAPKEKQDLLLAVDTPESLRPKVKLPKNYILVPSSSSDEGHHSGPSPLPKTKKSTSTGKNRSQISSTSKKTQNKRTTALFSREKLSEDCDRAFRLFKEDKFEQAVHIFEQILPDQIELLGRKDEDVLRTIHLLARGYFEEGDYDNAATCFNEALEIRLESFGTDHKAISDSWQWLGASRCMDERYAEAVFSLELAVKGWESLNHGGSYDERIWGCLKWLKRSFTKIGELPQAEHVASRMFESKKRALGLNHEDTLDAWFGLIEIYYEQSRYQEAKAAAYRLLQIQRETLGPNHKSTIRSLEFIVGIYISNDDGPDEQLETTFNDLFKCRVLTLGPTHEDTLNSLQWLGIARRRIEKSPEAEKALYRASRGQKETLGIGHAETVRSLWWLAESLQRQGKYREEVDVRKNVVTGHSILFGDTHEKTLTAKDELAAANEAFVTSFSDHTENVSPRPTFVQKASLKMKTLRNRWDNI